MSDDPLFSQLEAEEETFICEQDEAEKEAEVLAELDWWNRCPCGCGIPMDDPGYEKSHRGVQ